MCLTKKFPNRPSYSFLQKQPHGWKQPHGYLILDCISYYFTVKIAKNTWRNLRTTYGRERNKCIVRYSGMDYPEDLDDDLYTGNWVHFQKLHFFSKIMKARKTSGNLFTKSENEQPHNLLVHNNSSSGETQDEVPSNNILNDDRIYDFVDEYEVVFADLTTADNATASNSISNIFK